MKRVLNITGSGMIPLLRHIYIIGRFNMDSKTKRIAVIALKNNLRSIDEDLKYKDDDIVSMGERLSEIQAYSDVLLNRITT